MKKLLIILLVGAGAYHWYTDANRKAGVSLASHDEVIMYSLTTCGYCKQKRELLEAEGIDFVEYFIDRDRDRQDELNAKLAEAGFKPRRYGTPIFDVRGEMLPDNPSLEKIREYL